MRTAREIYGDSAFESCGEVCDYDPMLKEFGHIMVQVDEPDYQGDSLVLYQDGGRYGILTFGWGSCSGCDALMACDTFEEVDNLMAELWSEVLWFDTEDEVLRYFVNHDWNGDFRNASLVAKFICKAIVALAEEKDADEWGE